MERMIAEAKRLLKLVNADDEIYTLMAKAHKRAYDALVTAGFTSEQATQIIVHQGSGIKAS